MTKHQEPAISAVPVHSRTSSGETGHNSVPIHLRDPASLRCHVADRLQNDAGNFGGFNSSSFVDVESASVLHVNWDHTFLLCSGDVVLGFIPTSLDDDTIPVQAHGGPNCRRRKSWFPDKEGARRYVV